jgi:arylsulfatase A-like enzyme
VYFARAYCAAPVCNPSRAALMSGLRPFTTGVYENRNDWRTVVPENLTLPTTFRKAGYYVCGAGKIYHESFKPIFDTLKTWPSDLKQLTTTPNALGTTFSISLVLGLGFLPQRRR